MWVRGGPWTDFDGGIKRAGTCHNQALGSRSGAGIGIEIEELLFAGSSLGKAQLIFERFYQQAAKVAADDPATDPGCCGVTSGIARDHVLRLASPTRHQALLPQNLRPPLLK